ncbi:hypothetical protein KJ969_05140 [Patescibacteria group bacterium]|nr:hypothetical protein [Patescibacteria group bacterium]MBU1921607.1 hypothetical protein [Patescibacteria group bacterium]
MRKDYKAAFRFRKHKLRDHRRRVGIYKNPLFQSKKDKIAALKKIRKKIIFFGILFLVLVAVYFLLIGPYFYISEVKVDGLTTIKSDDFKTVVDDFLKTRRLLVFPNQNILIANMSKLEREIGERYVVDGLKIKRKLPNKLEISVEERSAKAVISMGSEYFFVDSQGIILRRLSLDEIYPGLSFGPFAEEPAAGEVNFQVSLIYIESGERLDIGENFLTNEQFNDIIGAQEILTRYTSYQVKFYKIKDLASTWFKLVADEGWEIHISLEKNIQTQIVKFNTFVKEQGLNPADYDYFNVRFEDHVYYK